LLSLEQDAGQGGEVNRRARIGVADFCCARVQPFLLKALMKKGMGMDNMRNDVLNKIKESIIEGNHGTIAGLLEKALQDGWDPTVILNDYMIPAMMEVGDLFEEKEVFIPEMMLSAKAMFKGMAVFEPLFSRGEVKTLGTMVIGTVKGDFHEIGKFIVAMVMKGSGINVIDLGVDVSAEQFAKAVKANDARILGMSALLTTTMGQMEETIKLFASEGLRDRVKIMVGGGPITEDFAREIGADYFGPNATAAARTARTILQNG
jgi:5-methyltetrahydrofolate--homocysteine methyltransferase